MYKIKVGLILNILQLYIAFVSADGKEVLISFFLGLAEMLVPFGVCWYLSDFYLKAPFHAKISG